MEISKGNVLVIGGSGYLGSHVADSLTEIRLHCDDL